MEKFSYSKINTFNRNDAGCPYRYKLQYVDKHYINESTVTLEFGTLVHFIEESIANEIIANDNEPLFLFDIDKFKDLFLNVNSKDALGIYGLKQKYPQTFYQKDKNGLSYEDKANIYLEKGIYRLINYLTENPTLKLVAAEKEFNLKYNDYIFHGFVDRIFQDTATGQYIIEDIKTYSAPKEHSELTTPLQFVIYTLAVRELYNTEDIVCAYELPLCDCKQPAGTKGYMKRGLAKIDSLFKGIENKEFEPAATPLCYWCVYSGTYPNQPEAAKGLCPYYCHWTPNNKDLSVENEWMGYENDAAIVEDFNKKLTAPKIQPVIEVVRNCINEERHFFIRRE